MLKSCAFAAALAAGLTAGAAQAMPVDFTVYDITVEGEFTNNGGSIPAPFPEVDFSFRLSVGSTVELFQNNVSAVSSPAGFDVPVGREVSLNNDFFVFDSHPNQPPPLDEDFVEITIDGFAEFLNSGTFDALSFSYGQADGAQAIFTASSRDLTARRVEVDVSAVPIPAAGVMLLTALAGLGFARRRMSAARA